MSEDTKSDSISSDEEVAFSSDEEDGLETTAVDHYESLVSPQPSTLDVLRSPFHSIFLE